MRRPVACRAARHLTPPEGLLTPPEGLPLRSSAGFGNRVLVGDLLHNSARNGSTIDRFCKTAVIDRLRKRPLMAALFFG